MATTNKYALVRFDHRTAEVIKGTEFELLVTGDAQQTMYTAIGRGAFEYQKYRYDAYTAMSKSSDAVSDEVLLDKTIEVRMDDLIEGPMMQMRIFNDYSRPRVQHQITMIGMPLVKWPVEVNPCLPGEKLEVFLVQVDPTYWVGGQ